MKTSGLHPKPSSTVHWILRRLWEPSKYEHEENDKLNSFEASGANGVRLKKGLSERYRVSWVLPPHFLYRHVHRATPNS
ncbi:uncharacterized protein VTP21DRAFT_9592 [Calcarisporiella thermophila]|uniref:uncharacterized protein n=1 Tax=Calcarisporiella thermophila TaxID=911321 RepID=UPI003743DB4A